MKEEIVLKHLAKYYNRKGRIINNDDILPMSRILPMMDEYAQEYHKAQSPTQQQAGNEWSDEGINYERFPNDPSFKPSGALLYSEQWVLEMLREYDNYKGEVQFISDWLSTYKKNNLKT